MAEIPQRLGVRQELELGLRQCQGDLKFRKICNKIENHENKSIWDFFRETNQCVKTRILVLFLKAIFSCNQFALVVLKKRKNISWTQLTKRFPSKKLISRNPIYKTTNVCLLYQFFSETAPPILMKIGIHFIHSVKMVLK